MNKRENSRLSRKPKTLEEILKLYILASLVLFEGRKKIDIDEYVHCLQKHEATPFDSVN